MSILPATGKLILQHRVINRVLLDESDARAVLRHIANLWGYEVMLVESMRPPTRS